MTANEPVLREDKHRLVLSCLSRDKPALGASIYAHPEFRVATGEPDLYYLSARSNSDLPTPVGTEQVQYDTRQQRMYEKKKIIIDLYRIVYVNHS